jgi:hypothetical protein
MITGHFGLAAGVKAHEWQVPLWALMLATVLLDIVFAPLLAAGVESIENVPGTSGGYGKAVIHADWTHSLVGALVLAPCSGWSPPDPRVAGPASCLWLWCSRIRCWIWSGTDPARKRRRPAAARVRPVEGA